LTFFSQILQAADGLSLVDVVLGATAGAAGFGFVQQMLHLQSSPTPGFELQSQLEKIQNPVMVIDGEGRLVFSNCQASQLSRREGEPGGQIEVLAALAQRFSELEPGYTEVRVAGRCWVLLTTPIITNAGSRARNKPKPLRMLCFFDQDNSASGRDRAALGYVAHDLRMPLVSMLALIDEHANRDESERTQLEPVLLAGLRRQIDYSLRVARDFLQLSRAEQLDRSMFLPLSLEDLVMEAIDHAWMSAQTKDIQLVGPLCALESAHVSGNASMLVRMMVNVLDNAIKYSPPGTTVLIKIQQQTPRTVVLHIIDQGRGISAEDLQRVFEPMVQVDQSTRQDEGVGLGLAFVKAVARGHGGDVLIASGQTIGTEVCISLPMA
jgi:signal transduction histidine kinase